jgi:RHS repeat-associated protein
MEQDDELGGNGNSYYTEFRQYDPRLGRWFSIDPIIHPWMSPYTAFDNNPVFFVDPFGLSTQNGDPKPKSGGWGNFWDKLKNRSPQETLKVWKNAVVSFVRDLFKSNLDRPLLVGRRGESGNGEDFKTGLNRQPHEFNARRDIERASLAQDGALLRDLRQTLKKGVTTHYLLNDLASQKVYDEVDRIVKHLDENSGRDYYSKILSRIAKNTDQIKNLQAQIKEQFEMSMDQKGNDYNKVMFAPNRPNFGFFSDDPALKTIIGGTQEIQVWLDDIKVDKNGSYTAVLRTIIYDDFGVNESDISHASPVARLGISGMAALWVLQNQRGYKPFRIKIEFNQVVKHNAK